MRSIINKQKKTRRIYSRNFKPNCHFPRTILKPPPARAQGRFSTSTV